MKNKIRPSLLQFFASVLFFGMSIYFYFTDPDLFRAAMFVILGFAWIALAFWTLNKEKKERKQNR